MRPPLCRYSRLPYPSTAWSMLPASTSFPVFPINRSRPLKKQSASAAGRGLPLPLSKTVNILQPLFAPLPRERPCPTTGGGRGWGLNVPPSPNPAIVASAWLQMPPDSAPSTKTQNGLVKPQASNFKPQNVRSTFERFLCSCISFTEENAFVSANCLTTKGFTEYYLLKRAVIYLFIPSNEP